MLKSKARLIGLGTYLPEKVLTNEDLEKLVDTSDEWIVTRTGMKERRIAASDESTSDMGAASAQRALEAAGLQAADIDLIIVATMTPDYISPSTAGIIQARIGAVNAAAFDVQAACTGFLYALSVAKAYVDAGMYRHVLVVATEKMSAFLDYSDRNTCILFGDGACSAVVAAEGSGWLVDHITLGAEGELADLVIIPGGGARHPASTSTVEEKQHFIRMQGKEVFKHAVRRMTAAVNECLASVGLKEQDISRLVPHQANERIIDAIAKACSMDSKKVFKTLHKYGNTSASSIAIALNELLSTQQLQKGEHILLVAFGGGLTWGAAVITKI
jgi:3-oxoacyl-[acyl-carrier-protein] synthase-3